MAEIADYKKAIKCHLERAERSYMAFIKVLKEKKPEPYMELRIVELYQSMMIVTNALNKVKYSKLDTACKINQKKEEAEQHEQKNANEDAKKGRDNKDNSSGEENKAVGKEKQVESAKKPIKEDGAGATLSNDDEITKMILTLYDLTEYHKAMTLDWRRKVHEMVTKGRQIKWGSVEKVFWNQFEATSSQVMARLVD